jgi:hypothetical protein
MTKLTSEILSELDFSTSSAEDDALVAELEALSGDYAWHEHLPFNAIMQFHEVDKVRSQYNGHVNDCVYCQQMIDTIHPTDKMLKELQVSRMAALAVYTPLEENSSIDSVLDQIALSMDPELSVLGIDRANVMKDNSVYATSTEPNDHFEAARRYFVCGAAESAYHQLSEGLVMSRVNSAISDQVASVFNVRSTPEDLAKTAAQLWEDLPADRELWTQSHKLTAMTANAQLGDHKAAMRYLGSSLHDGEDDFIEIG